MAELLMLRLILAALALLAPSVANAQWADPYTYDLGDIVDPRDCTHSGCSLDSAMESAIASCESKVAEIPIGQNRYATGCKLKIPAGDHTLSSTFSFCRSYVIEGAGGTTNRQPLTNISVSKTAFIARGFGDCRATGEGHGGAITVTGLGLNAPPTSRSAPIIGIDAHAPITVDNVWMTYFDVSLAIRADVNLLPPSNANVFRVNNFTSDYSQHSAIVIEGGDTNAGSLTALNINTACMGPTEALVAEFGECTGLLESSFLGSFVSNSHFGIAGGYPDFIFEGASNRGTCMGCYVEGPDRPRLDSQHSMWVGGIGPAPLGPGFRMAGRTTEGLIIRNALDPANVVQVELGASGNLGGVFYTLRQFGLGTGSPFRMRWNPSTLDYLEDIGNTSLGWIRSMRGHWANDRSELGQTCRHDDVTPIAIE